MAEESLLSGQISFTGLGSGTDFNTIVEKLIQIEGNHKTQLENWKLTWENKIEAIQQLNTAMLSLKTSLDGMDTMNEFMTKSVSSSDSTTLTASADAEAAEGSHTVEIYQLAQTMIMANNTGVSDTSTSINNTGSSQTFVYSYAGGSDVSLSVADGTTLEGLKNLINSDPDNPGVRAAIITDGSQHYLQLRGLDMGSDASISISASTTLSGYAASDFDTTQNNQDSWIKIDGWPTGSNAWIKTASNTVSNAIEDVTLTLKTGPSTPGTSTTVTLSINTDQEGIKESVRTFVDKVNEVRQIFIDMTEFNENEEQGSVMTGNYAVQLVDSGLRFAAANLAKGFAYYDATDGTGDYYSSLSQLGITTDAQKGSATEGLLILDEEVLDAALDNNVNAVAELFAADHVGAQKVTSSSGNFSYYSHIDGITEAGSYDVRYQIDGSGDIVNAYINGNAASIDNTNNLITGTADSAEQGIVIQVNDLTPSTTVTGEVRLKQGKAGELSDLLADYTDSDQGPLNILEDNYDDIVDNIDKKIDAEEIRLEKRSRELRLKFARLEALLGTYDQQSTSLSNQIDKLE
ncbi:MAG: flagellar hook protein [Desulfovibrio sp.]|nr:MAG: flagellar hook protein [Desulfovibrio sp.]